MANDEHLAILKQGVEEWNQWRRSSSFITPDLSNADLHGMELIGVDLRGVDLSGANLEHATFSRDFRNIGIVMAAGDVLWGVPMNRADICGADLSWANLRKASFVQANLSCADIIGADLYKACFREAYLRDASFRDAKLIEADLNRAILARADFTRADLSKANLSGATIGFTEFTDVNLRFVKGLETLKHEGPSTIGIDTIYRSDGNIPDAFLKGAGVPDDMIGYIHSIAGAIQFHSCFISYSSKDQEFAERLHADLQAKGVRCWFAPHDVQGGKKLHEQIDQAIRIYDKLLLILSEDSMNSEWVKTEIANARQRELKEKRQMLFPVSLVPFERIRDWKAFDADTGKDSAREIREYYIPDFSNWKNHDSYQKAFDRLLRDLKAEDGNRRSEAAGTKP